MIHRIEDITDPRLDDYRNLIDGEQRRERRGFIAEGRFVVRTLLMASRFRARSVLVTDAALESLRDARGVAESADPGFPVLVLSQSAMNSVVGFDIHRGCLAAGDRGSSLAAADVVRGALGRPVVVLEGVNNHDNIGSIFRNAGAFDVGGVLMDAGCVDPLYRKAIRVSMGGTLRVPFAVCEGEDWRSRLRALHTEGYTVLALTPGAGAVDIREFGGMRAMPERVALLFGAEGDGLSAGALAAADERVRIPIVAGVDSLNVAAAAAVALHRFSRV